MNHLDTLLKNIREWTNRPKEIPWEVAYIADLDLFIGYYLLIKKHPNKDVFRSYLVSQFTGNKHSLCLTGDLLLASIGAYELLLHMEEPPIQ